MTVSSTTFENIYTADGSTTTWTYSYRIFQASDLVVRVVDTSGNSTIKVLNNDYTVANVLNYTGGTITFNIAPTVGYTIIITRDPAILQNTTLTEGATYPAKTVENMVDLLTEQMQVVRDIDNRSIQFPTQETSFNSTLPTAANRASSTLGFDTSGNLTTTKQISNTTVSSAMIPVVQAATLALSRAAMGPWNDISTLGYFNVLDHAYGAKGDGVTDDTAAINSAIAACMSLGDGGVIYFPRVNLSGGIAKYKITSTIVVYGARGITFRGEMDAVNLNPTAAYLASASCIFWGGSNSSSPMFYFGSSSIHPNPNPTINGSPTGNGFGNTHNTFENLYILGSTGSDGVYMATAGIWIDETSESITFKRCFFSECGIGIRICSGLNHATSVWTPGVSAFNAVTYPGAVSNGGFASDGLHLIDCSFGWCGIGVSIESAQALDMIFDGCLFSFCGNQLSTQSYYGYSIFIAACQGLQLNSPTFLNATIAEINVSAFGSFGLLTVIGAHQEGGAGAFFQSTLTSAPLGTGILFQSCGGGSVLIKGLSGTVCIKGSILSSVVMQNSGPSLVIEDSTLTSLDNTGPGGNPMLRLVGVTVTTTLGSNALNYLLQDFTNINLPGWTQAALAGRRISTPGGYSPALLLGNIPTSSAVGGMEGVAITPGANSVTFCWGCYQNSSGVIIATNANGGCFVAYNTAFVIKGFTGATPGATPTFTQFASFGAPATGYGTPTNGARISSMNGSTAYTNTQLSGILAQLILDLKAQGLIAS